MMTTVTEIPVRAQAAAPAEATMKLRYGINEIQNWRNFALGPGRQSIWERCREAGTSVVRILVYDQGTPDPAAEWPAFAACLRAVQSLGAVPMITFSRFPAPFDDAGAIGGFAARCEDIVGRAVEEWGGEAARDWYWCIGHEPNSEWSGARLSFEQYRRIYEEVAPRIRARLAPHLGSRKARIGGPAANGFLPFWMDWIWRFVQEIDNSLIGFASWHCYGDWREPGAWGAPTEEPLFRALLMSRTREYESRAAAVSRLLRDGGILNVCGELNAHSHHEGRVSGPYNQTVFGAAYYASALLHLLRGGADMELLRSGTDDGGTYGMLDSQGRPTPVFFAKSLCARHLRRGDRLWFPPASSDGLLAVVARAEDGRCGALLVHQNEGPRTFPAPDWTAALGHPLRLLKVDRSAPYGPLETPFDGAIAFDGYGVAALTNQ